MVRALGKNVEKESAEACGYLSALLFIVVEHHGMGGLKPQLPTSPN